jgi:UDP-N-acetylmuramoyl-L-alanyl-D-glutamate--2,6-diaminopimelate ligase
MAYEVEKLSDYAVVTSDNPRTEDPEAIIQEILVGFTGTRDNFEYVAITDRREALKHALTIAKPGDVVLAAGKGHEDYQDVKGVKHYFSDQEECRKILEN